MTSSEDWTRGPGLSGTGSPAARPGQGPGALDWWNARSPDGSLELFLPAAGAYGAPQTVRPATSPSGGTSPSAGRAGRCSPTPPGAGRPWARWGSPTTPSDDTPYPETLLRRPAAQAQRRRLGLRRLRGRQPARTRTACSATGWSPTPPTSSARTACSPTTTTATSFANFDAVLAHEMGHVFGALDEYAPAVSGYPSTGDLTSGYLGVRNGNAVRGGTTDLPCIMRGSNGTLGAFARRGPLPLDGRPDGPAGQRHRHAAGRGGHAAGLLHAARVDRPRAAP